jgi:O-acetyl-ADP-ribose deacetylase (regulator of RNase III)
VYERATRPVSVAWRTVRLPDERVERSVIIGLQIENEWSNVLREDSSNEARRSVFQRTMCGGAQCAREYISLETYRRAGGVNQSAARASRRTAARRCYRRRLMIRFTQGNLLEAPAEALVNTVNEIGIMGKGIALIFRDAFPANTKAYEEAARAGHVRVGHMLVTNNGSPAGPKWIINFPTKKHWRNPSKLEWVVDGLQDLVRVIREKNIHSVALPALGCGNGGLDWAVVRREIESALAGLDDVEVNVYEPQANA